MSGSKPTLANPPVGTLISDDAVRAAFVAFYRGHKAGKEPLDAMRDALAAAYRQVADVSAAEGGPPPLRQNH